jgi:hypothetical protein
MVHGGKKIEKPQRTKFRKNSDHENRNFDKKKHHDKTLYRLAKEEKELYVV